MEFNISKRVKFNTSVDEKLLNEIREITERLDVPVSKCVDASFECFIEKIKGAEKNKKSNNTASK